MVPSTQRPALRRRRTNAFSMSQALGLTIPMATLRSRRSPAPTTADLYELHNAGRSAWGRRRWLASPLKAATVRDDVRLLQHASSSGTRPSARRLAGLASVVARASRNPGRQPRFGKVEAAETPAPGRRRAFITLQGMRPDSSLPCIALVVARYRTCWTDSTGQKKTEAGAPFPRAPSQVAGARGDGGRGDRVTRPGRRGGRRGRTRRGRTRIGVCRGRRWSRRCGR